MEMDAIRTESPIDFTSLPGQIKKIEKLECSLRNSIISTQPRTSRRETGK